MKSCSLQAREAKCPGNEDPGGSLDGGCVCQEGNAGNHPCLRPGMAWPHFQLCPGSETGSEHKARALSHPRIQELGLRGSTGAGGWGEGSELGKLGWFQQEGELSLDLGCDGIKSNLTGVSHSLPRECCQNTLD